MDIFTEISEHKRPTLPNAMPICMHGAVGVSTIQKTKAMLCAIPTFHTYLSIHVNIKREVVCVAQHKMFRYSAKEYLIPAKTMMEDKLV